MSRTPWWLCAEGQGKWEEEIRYVFEERAAILEFDAGLSREDAEAKAFAMMLQTDEQKKT